MQTMNEIPKFMSAALLVGHGGTEQLIVTSEVRVPSVGKGDVLIRVGAAAVNNTDINTRTGWYSKSNNDAADASWSGEPLIFPRIQGADVCGEIIAVGEGVSDSRIGQRVLIEPCLQVANGKNLEKPWYFGSECDGGFAEYTVVASRHAYAVSTTLSDVELASFPCSYSTAENMLSRANVIEGETVLVTGASGGVGSAAVQLAKVRGAKVIAVASESKFAQLIDIGADKVVSRHADLSLMGLKETIDVVIDLVAGEKWASLIACLKPKGRYVVSGAIGGALVELDIRTLYLKDLTFCGCTVIGEDVFPRLISLIEKGKVRPLVAHTYGLKDIVKAQEAFEAKKHVGKIVLHLHR